MPTIAMREIASFHAWVRLLINNQESYFIRSPKIQLDLYGHDDSAYLVLDVYTTEINFTQYVFIVAEPVNDHKTIVLLFDFLRTLDFSLKKLMIWLAQAIFSETQMGWRCETCGFGNLSQYA